MRVGDAASASAPADRVRSVEFIGMDAPSTPNQKASVYSSAKVRVTTATGAMRTYALAYNQLMATGRLFDPTMQPLMDANGQIASTGPRLDRGGLLVAGKEQLT